MKLRPMCVVLTQDDAVKYYGAHEPIAAKAGGHITMNINLTEQSLSLRFCKRCGVAYVEASSVTFDKASPDGNVSPQGGNA